MEEKKAVALLDREAPHDRSCVQCGRTRATMPLLAGAPTRCTPCWQERVDVLRRHGSSVKVRKLHRNALASEFELTRGEERLGRLILFRDSMTLCVRFLSTLNGESEVILEETLKTLLGSWPHDYLDVEIIDAGLSGHRKAAQP